MKPLQVKDESVAGRRDLNEDSVLVATLSDGRRLLAVADGMGGHAAGEVASAMALEVLEGGLEDGLSLEASCKLANERVHAESESDIEKKGMGTTLVVLLVAGDQYEIANIGDSRGYEISSDGIHQVTEDHSFVAEAVRRGHDEDEAMQSQYRDALLRCIGTSAEVEVDIFGPFSADRDVAVLLCSDGLYKTLTPEDMGELFCGSEDLDVTTQTLVSAAYDAGSDDNISVLLAEWGEVPRDTELYTGLGSGGGGAAATLMLDEPFVPPVDERVADEGAVSEPVSDPGVADHTAAEPVAAGDEPTDPAAAADEVTESEEAAVSGWGWKVGVGVLVGVVLWVVAVLVF